MTVQPEVSQQQDVAYAYSFHIHKANSNCMHFTDCCCSNAGQDQVLNTNAAHNHQKLSTNVYMLQQHSQKSVGFYAESDCIGQKSIDQMSSLMR